MLLVSIADAEFKDRVLFSMEQATKFGYNMKVYDMGGLDFGEECPNILEALDIGRRAQVCMSKPAMVLDALENTDQTVVYMDADAFLVRSIDEIETDDYDIGVTYKGGETRTYINAGVLFIKNNPRAKKFMKMWMDAIDQFEDKLKMVNVNQLGDQIFLNDLVFSYVQKGRLLNTVQDVGGVRVKFFDYRDYNNFNLARNVVVKTAETHIKALPSNTRIVHLRHSHPDTYLEVKDKWQM